MNLYFTTYISYLKKPFMICKRRHRTTEHTTSLSAILCLINSCLLWFQSYEKEAAARQLEVAELRKTGEVHRKRVRALEQEVASQRIIAKVCSETTACNA